MAKARDIRNRIRSVRNTKKITRTMELVATARSKQTQTRMTAVAPYRDLLTEVAVSLLGTAAEEGEALLVERDPARRAAVLVITANRGLCGGYNSGVLRTARNFVEVQQRKGQEVEVSVSGRKGIAWLRYNQVPVAASYTHLDYRPAFADVLPIADGFIDRFRAGDLDEVYVAFSHYESLSSQRPIMRRVVPISRKDLGKAGRRARGRHGYQFICEPTPGAVLSAVLPQMVRLAVFGAFLEAATSEQIARRIAMKKATDAAEEMVSTLTRRYNRARQAQITQTIAEVVGGSAALT